MSPRRVRFEARVFRGESVAFEACTSFRADAAAGHEVCHCGWLEDDHRAARRPAVAALRRRSPVGVPTFARRAS
jgi:hypothetical protein